MKNVTTPKETGAATGAVWQAQAQAMAMATEKVLSTAAPITPVTVAVPTEAGSVEDLVMDEECDDTDGEGRGDGSGMANAGTGSGIGYGFGAYEADGEGWGDGTGDS
jgi:hypothetical protein